MYNCPTCGRVRFEFGEVAAYAGPICHCTIVHPVQYPVDRGLIQRITDLENDLALARGQRDLSNRAIEELRDQLVNTQGELKKWTDIFGHLGTPDEIGNMWYKLTGKNQEIILILRKATLGSCTCLTKTPEVKYHAEHCSYKLISTAIEKLEKIEED